MGASPCAIELCPFRLIAHDLYDAVLTLLYGLWQALSAATPHRRANAMIATCPPATGLLIFKSYGVEGGIPYSFGMLKRRPEQ